MLLYTILANVIIILLFPVCRLITEKPLNAHLSIYLSSPVRFQLDLIYSKYDLHASTNMPSSREVFSLLAVSILAPGYAVGLAIAAWVAASFWFFAAILGNPDGKDDRNDGQAAVLGVRVWWERWLMKGLSSA